MQHKTSIRGLIADVFVGLTNNLSAGALTNANCGQKHLTLFPLESVLRHNYRVFKRFTDDSLKAIDV